jgi:hypothetical protein
LDEWARIGCDGLLIGRQGFSLLLGDADFHHGLRELYRTRLTHYLAPQVLHGIDLSNLGIHGIRFEGVQGIFYLELLGSEGVCWICER